MAGHKSARPRRQLRAGVQQQSLLVMAELLTPRVGIQKRRQGQHNAANSQASSSKKSFSHHRFCSGAHTCILSKAALTWTSVERAGSQQRQAVGQTAVNVIGSGEQGS